MDYIETSEDLRAIYGPVSDGAVRKQMASLDIHSRNFLAHAPFAVLGTQSPEGFGDVTPRGDGPGFVAVLDDTTLALPDRPGNRRLDSLQNVLANPKVGLIFIIPGMNESLRINGTARITSDPALCERLAINGRPALTALVVSIHEVYMHCSKAFIRSALWKPDTWPERGILPTLGQMLKDQARHQVSADQIDESLEENYRSALW